MYNYPAIRSMWRETKFTVYFSFILFGYGFLSPGFTDRRAILHGGSATSQTGLRLFWGKQPQRWPSYGRQQGAIWRNMLFC